MYVSTKLALQVWAGLVVALVSTLSFPIADQILLWNFVVCDHLWENPACGIFYETKFDAYLIKLYHRANPCSSFRLIACFAVELQRFVYDRATSSIIKKLRSKGVAMHVYGISIYYVYTGSQLNGLEWSRSI